MSLTKIVGIPPEIVMAASSTGYAGAGAARPQDPFCRHSMKRAARLDALPISVDRSQSRPLWLQVSIGLRVAIANGRLRRGQRLPSTRALARQLAVSRNVVIAA